MEISALRTIIWSQFASAMHMLGNSITKCPDTLWVDQSLARRYWYLAYHTLFFLDLYLSDSENGFLPPVPFTLSELDPSGGMPDRVYTRKEMLDYLNHCREKCRSLLENLTDPQLAAECKFGWLSLSRGELLLYNMRHLQHHCAQMNLMLRQQAGEGSRWISRTDW
jgi:hypothetical protein